MHDRAPLFDFGKLILLAVIPLTLLIRNYSGVFFLPGADFSDLLVSHFPNAVFIHNSVASFQAIPLWSNTILSGYPLIANPLSGLFYPPGWLSIFWPEVWVFNLLSVWHLFWAGLGMFVLLRKLKLNVRSAVFGGLAFGALPKLIAHLGAGHITLVYAVSWTPWLLQTIYQPQGNRRLRLDAGLILGLIFLADPRWSVYAGGAYILFYLLERESGPRNPEAAYPSADPDPHGYRNCSRSDYPFG